MDQAQRHGKGHIYFDPCQDKALPDEPRFTLLARDPIAPILVMLWAELRGHLVGNPSKVGDARAVAENMRAWHAHRSPRPSPTRHTPLENMVPRGPLQPVESDPKAVRWQTERAVPASPLERDFENAINSHSRENLSNMNDFTLARFLIRSLEALEEAVQSRDRLRAPLSADAIRSLAAHELNEWGDAAITAGVHAIRRALAQARLA